MLFETPVAIVLTALLVAVENRPALALFIILVHAPIIIRLLSVRPDFARHITRSTEHSAVDTMMVSDSTLFLPNISKR